MFRNFKILDEKDKRLRMISKEVTFPLSKEEKDTINDVMKDSIEHHKISDVEVGSFLSSGVD